MKLPQEMHPEFGYLHPSSETRRTMRVALAAAAFGIVVGAGATLGMTGSHGASTNQAEQAMTVGHGDRGVVLGESFQPAPVHTATPRKWHSGRALASTVAAPSATQVATAPAAAARVATAPAAAASSVPLAVPLASTSAEGTLTEAPAADVAPPKKDKTARKKKRHIDEGASAFASPFGRTSPFSNPWRSSGGWN